jgi:hypothetical protein
MAEQELDANNLLSKIQGLLSSTPKPGSVELGQAVPYERFHAMKTRAEAAESGLSEMQTAIKALETGHKDELKQVRKDSAEQVTQLGLQHQEGIRLRDMGLDDAGRDALRSTWNRQPEADRGASPSEWWGTVLEASKAHQAGGDKPKPEIPRTLEPYLPQPEAPKGDAPNRPTLRGGVTVGLSPDRNASTNRDRQGSSHKISNATNPNDFWAAVAEADRG